MYNNHFISAESLAIPDRLVSSAWIGHIPFAQWLVSICKPSLFVELGVFKGSSYCSICEALQRNHIFCKAYGIDTWQGDKHNGYYDEEIFLELSQYHSQRYADFSVLLRTLFDEAVKKFSDKSIDLLHIDGLHTYEAVKNDFLTWLPKMSDSGVILFHDTQVKGVGVWKLWEEIKGLYPSFEFSHWYGLGILLTGKHQPAVLSSLCKMNDKATEEIQMIYSGLADRLNNFVLTWGEEGKKGLEIANNREMGALANNRDLIFYSLGRGWWPRVEAGRNWSVAEEAEITLAFTTNGKRRIYLDLAAFLPTHNFVRHVEITANDMSLGEVVFKWRSKRKKCYFKLLENLGQVVKLKIQMKNLIAPLEVKISQDSRKLGVALFGFGIEKLQNESVLDKLPFHSRGISRLLGFAQRLIQG